MTVKKKATKKKAPKVRQQDKYDRAIEYLTKHPDRIFDAWTEPCKRRDRAAQAHCLFQYVGNGPHAGCLTQIRHWASDRKAYSPELQAAIVKDKRIPSDPFKVRVKHLPVFAEWQRKIDEMGYR